MVTLDKITENEMGRESVAWRREEYFCIKLWFDILRITVHIGGADCCGFCLNVLSQFELYFTGSGPE